MEDRSILQNLELVNLRARVQEAYWAWRKAERARLASWAVPSHETYFAPAREFERAYRALSAEYEARRAALMGGAQGGAICYRYAPGAKHTASTSVRADVGEITCRACVEWIRSRPR